PLHSLAAADRELSPYLLIDNEWKKLTEIQELLECFQKATLEMSIENFPTLGQSVPVYNYLIDIIEDFIEKVDLKSQNIINTANIIDPRHKMQYYKDNEFEEEYIDAYKNQITNL
ncbi:hypothetical protein C1646_768274, partial [Rhizophagus diaphanus]